MGICASKVVDPNENKVHQQDNIVKQSYEQMKNEDDPIEEKEVKQLFESSLNSLKKIKQIESSICIINGIAQEEKDDIVGTGYLMKFRGKKFILTNHHVIWRPNLKYVAILAVFSTLRIQTNFKDFSRL